MREELLMRLSWTIALGAAVSVGGFMVACGSDGDPPNVFAGPGDGGGVTGDETGEPSFPDAAPLDVIPSLEIKPHDPVLVSSGSPVTQPFQAFVSGVASPAKWSIDNVSLGAVDAITGPFQVPELTGIYEKPKKVYVVKRT